MKFFNNVISYIKDTDIYIPKINFLERFLEKALIMKELHSIQNSFRNATTLQFYTDGSVVNIRKELMSMSLAFYQNHFSALTARFKATLEHFSSSTYAKTAAVLAALLTAPTDCQVDIFTDSKSTIDHALFTCLTTCLFFKEENNIIWSMIRQIIKDNNLHVTFHKVKAHSNNYAND